MDNAKQNVNVLSNHLYKQVQCLRVLENKFNQYDMSTISNQSEFSDMIWRFREFDMPDLNWDTYFSSEQYPLMLLCKVTVYSQITYSNKAISYIRCMKDFMGKFGELLLKKNILTINDEAEIKGLDSISHNDIQLVIENHIKANSKRFSQNAISFFSALAAIPKDLISDAPFLGYSCDLPWTGNMLGWQEDIESSLNYYHSKRPYPPIPFPIVSEIVSNASEWLKEEHHSIVSEVFNLVRNNQEKNSKRESRQNKPVINSYISKVLKDKYASYFEPLLPMEYNSKGVIKMEWLNKLFKLVRSSCCQIILLTSGIRNVDLRHLQVGCCIPSKRNDLLYYLVLNIKKTKLKNYIIPVPQKTYDAIKLLENIRWDLSSVFLLNKVSISGSSSSIIRNEGEEWAIADTKVVSEIIKFFFNYYDIPTKFTDDNDYEATAHCYRTTLAGWIGQHSHMAIILLKKIFGHSNGVMPDAYLKHNPIVKKKRAEIIQSSHDILATRITDAVMSKKISGGKAKSLKAGVSNLNDELNQSNSKLEGDLKMTIKEQFKELLLGRIATGQMYAMLTPLSVVCLRNAANTTESPCSHEKYRRMRKDKVFVKSISETLGTLPDPANCVGNKCQDSLLGDWSLPLYETYEYYKNLLLNTGNPQSDIELEAELFIKQYGPDLKDVFEDIQLELA